MRKSVSLYLALAGTASAAGFPLGVGNSLSLPGSGVISTAVDAAGSVYLLQTEASGVLKPTAVLATPATTPSSYVTKLFPDGSKTVFVTELGFTAGAMAVDPAGYVYVASDNFVEKLDVSGASVIYRFQVALECGFGGMAVDSGGHVFVTGGVITALATTPNAFQKTGPAAQWARSFVAKINAAGNGFDYATYFFNAGITQPSAIAISSSGDAFIAGVSNVNLTAFLARLSADGSSLVYSIPLAEYDDITLAVTSDGSAVVYQGPVNSGIFSGFVNTTGVFYGALVRRFNPQGTAVEFSRTLLGASGFLSVGATSSVAVDTAGNTYIAGVTNNASFPVKDNLAPCTASTYLMILDPSGNLIQSTYVPGAGSGTLLLASGGVYMTGLAADGESISLVKLSPSAQPQTTRLACLGNVATNVAGPVAAGEIVSLYGESFLRVGLSPDSAAGSVTFNGIPAPLLYTDAGQISVIVPWEIESAATTKVCESYSGAAPSCMTLDVVPAVPAVFMADDSYAVALNGNGTVNSAANPAELGEMVSIFATGLGPITPIPQDGAIAMPPVGTNVFPVTFFISLGAGSNGETINPAYVGPVPFGIYGLSEIKVRASGNSMNLQVELPQTSAGPAVAWGQQFQIHVGPVI